MNEDARPRRLRLSSSRAMVCDVLHLDRQIPSFAHDRLCDLSRLIDVRATSRRRISWPVLFIKAYAVLAAECPSLRRAYMPWPWPQLYEHPVSVASLAMSRAHAGDERLCWLRLRSPERAALGDLRDKVDRAQRQPIEETFGRQILYSRFPTVVRRIGWWATVNLSGSYRAQRTGTFALTTLAGQGAEIQRPPSIHTSTLTYGPFDERGRSRVTVVYDHRVMDGLTIARCLARLERILAEEIAEELSSLREPEARAA